MIPAFVTASEQTEKTRGFDDLYHYIENLDVFEYGQEEARAYYIPGHHVLLNGKWKFFYRRRLYCLLRLARLSGQANPL